MRLISPFVRVQIGDDIFQTGDGKLQSVFVELSESDRSSNCGFTLNDPGLAIAARYFDISFQYGGIQVPIDLFGEKQAVEQANDSSRSRVSGTSADNSQTPEIRAWLDTIAYSEGTYDKGENGYNVLFGGGLFQGYADHPRRVICRDGTCSSAAGRYQFLSQDPDVWDEVRSQIGVTDFSRESQDKAAVQRFRYRGAYEDVLRGEAGFSTALRKLNSEWTSLTGGGEQRFSAETLFQVYRQNLAKYRASSSGSTSSAPTLSPQQTANSTPIAPVTNDDKKLEEFSSKGTEIIVEMGYPGSLVAYHFIHTGTDASGRSPDTTSFQGQCIRWLMTRQRKNTAYQNLTLKQLAQKVATAYGLKLQMAEDGPTYSFLSQDGITDYQLLLREARAIGFGIRDDHKNTLIVEPLRPHFTGFVITRDILIDKGALRFSDKASSDRVPLASLSNNPPIGSQADPKTAQSRLTGQNQQVAVEDTSATGKTGVMITGGTSKEIHGTPAPQSAAAPITPTAAAAITAVVPTIESPVETVKAGRVLPNILTGLPDQKIGAIMLGTDGRAEAQRLISEQKRVKGYESSARLIMTPESVTIAPGSIIAISTEVVPYPFAREWRVATARHSIQAGKATTELHFYSPQAANNDKSDGAQTNPVDNSGQPTAPDGKLQNPAVGSDRGTPFNPNGLNGIRRHTGIDLSGGTTTIIAAESGTVKSADDQGDGYGNCIEILHDGKWQGYSTLYAHLDSFAVRPGQKVSKGQAIGVMGNTGHSRGLHLHFEVRSTGGARVDPEPLICPAPTGIYGEGAGTPIKSRC